MDNFNENQPQQQEQQASFQPQPEQPQYQQPVQPQVQPQYQYQQPGAPQQKPTVPNAVATLVLGILAVITSCYFIGVIFGIIGLVLGNKGKQTYKANPSAYAGYGMLNAGFICSIIGTAIGGLMFLIGLIAGGIGALSSGIWAFL